MTLSFSRESRHEAAPGRALGSGVIAACTVLLVRVGVLATILNPAVGWRVWPYLLLPLAAGLGISAAIRRWRIGATGAPLPGNPLRLGAAIQMALIFQAVLYAVEWVRRWFGSPGVLLSAAGLGLTDVDALTYAMTRFPADGAGSRDGGAGARGGGAGEHALRSWRSSWWSGAGRFDGPRASGSRAWRSRAARPCSAFARGPDHIRGVWSRPRRGS